jgi:iron complex outermembrane recepter protein
MISRMGLLASSGLVAALMSTSALAQQGGGNTIEELVVTAEKREQSLQDVPVAISAFTSEKRDLVGINTVQDMTNFTPGLQYSTQNDRISLRGVGRLNNSHAADSSVAVYSDGIYSTSTVQAGETPIFIDRLEVLRGPQGTLYGRNSVGGAINIVSRKPTKELYAEVRGTYANYNRHLLEGAVSGPITDNIQFRVAANWDKQTKGWFENISTNGAPDEGGVIDTTFVEGQLAVQFSDRFETWLKVSLIGWDNGAGGPGSRSSYTNALFNTALVSGQVPVSGFGYNPLATNVVNNGCPNPPIPTINARKICLDTPGTVRLTDTIIVASNWVYHADKFDLKYITGGTKYHYTLTGDQDGTGVASFSTCYTQTGAARAACLAGTTAPINYPTKYEFNYQEIEEWWSHEVNVISTGDGPFQYVLGAFLYHETYDQPVFTKLVNESRLDGPVAGATALVFDRHIFDNRPHFNLHSQAVFGQIDWQFMPKLKTTIGVRYGSDRKHGYERVRIVNAPGVTLPTVGFDVNAFLGGAGGPGVVSTTYDPVSGFKTRLYADEWKALTGTFGLQYDPNEDTMVYAKYSRGYKAGGFRIGIDTSLGGFPRTDKELLDSYEVGMKTNIGRTLQINGSAFLYSYRNAQIPLAQPSAVAGGVANSILFNVPKARTLGVELEGIWQPVDGLQILANYSYLDPKITKGLAIDPADTCATQPGARRTQATTVADAFCGAGQVQYLQDLDGNSMPNSAKHRFTVNGNYTWDLDKGAVTASATYVWRGAQYGSIFNRSYWKSPSFDQVDGRISYRDTDDHYTIIAFAKNIFNSLGYANGALATRRTGSISGGTLPSTILGISTAYELNPPRTYGIELQYRF